MAKFRKKPVVIEAFRWDGDLMNSDGEYYVPDWAVEAVKKDDIFFLGQGEMYINTLEGDHHASVGDYIIQGIQGEIYPCKPDIFEATYEPVEVMQFCRHAYVDGKECPICKGVPEFTPDGEAAVVTVTEKSK